GGDVVEGAELVGETARLRVDEACGHAVALGGVAAVGGEPGTDLVGEPGVEFNDPVGDALFALPGAAGHSVRVGAGLRGFLGCGFSRCCPGGTLVQPLVQPVGAGVFNGNVFRPEDEKREHVFAGDFAAGTTAPVGGGARSDQVYGDLVVLGSAAFAFAPYGCGAAGGVSVWPGGTPAEPRPRVGVGDFCRGFAGRHVRGERPHVVGGPSFAHGRPP